MARELKQMNQTKRILRVPKPKHAEEFSLRECARFQPWRVVLKVELCEGDLNPVDYELYVRALTPDDVMHTSYQLFYIWEHNQIQRETEFPRIMSGSQSYMEKIEDRDYEEQWKFIQQLKNGKVRKGGDSRNPSFFRWSPTGWDIPQGLVAPSKPTIIMPGEEAVAMTNATKNRK